MHPGRRTPVKSVGTYCAVVAASTALLWLGTPGAMAAPNLSGMTVVLDPGHSGLSDASLDRPVPTGRGGTKPCQSTGTATDGGYPEHAFNWDVVNRIQQDLSAQGIHTQPSRTDDASVGPCVDQRAAAANALHPDAIVSIHADGGPPAGHGFHVNYSAPPLNDAQSGPALQLATVMRDSLVAAGMAESTYIGAGGLYGRADLAGLNLAQYPAVLVEMGNMRNAGDAAQMESPDGRQRYADAVAAGIVAYLDTKAPAN
jgi:N-acetylmuramoyl-L-alanine amidase